MAKFVFFAVFLAALVAVSVAQGEAAAQRFRDMQCRREVQENPLDACRQVLDRQLTGRARVVSIPFQAGVRMRCCQQLQEISRECRCAAIRRMVREYEQTMVPLEEGYPGEKAELQEQGFYGETAEQKRQQQQPQEQEGEGFYGETAERQQEGEGFYGEETAGRQQREEVYGERAQQEEEGGGFYGQTAQQQQQQQQGEGRCRQTAERSQQGQENYIIRVGQQAAEEEIGETDRQGRGFVGLPPRVGTEQQIARVRLTKVRQYVARLPTMCQIEPQECSVFSGQYY